MGPASVDIRPAGEVVLVKGVEPGEIEFVVDGVVERVLKANREKLTFQIDGEEARAGVDVFVAGHGHSKKSLTLVSLDIPFGSPQNAAHEIGFSTASLGVMKLQIRRLTFVSI